MLHSYFHVIQILQFKFPYLNFHIVIFPSEMSRTVAISFVPPAFLFLWIHFCCQGHILAVIINQLNLTHLVDFIQYLK